MIATNEIASITILVPCHRGKEIINQIIPFKIFRQQQQYKAIPLISEEEKKMTGLSEDLYFKFSDDKVQAEGETKENVDAINNIIRELKMLRIV